MALFMTAKRCKYVLSRIAEQEEGLVEKMINQVLRRRV
jgi:hypothetical protein